MRAYNGYFFKYFRNTKKFKSCSDDKCIGIFKPFIFSAKKKLKQIFINKKNSKVSIIRIAAHVNEIKKISKSIGFLKSLGYTIALNVMQISECSNEKIEEITKIICNTKTDILYFADSLGSLNTENIKNIVEIIKKIGKKKWDFMLMITWEGLHLILLKHTNRAVLG